MVTLEIQTIKKYTLRQNNVDCEIKSASDQLLLSDDLIMNIDQSNNTTTTLPIVFDASKNEIFQVTDNYKTLYRKLKSNYRVEMYV